MYKRSSGVSYSSLIDHVCTTISNHVIYTGVIETDVSDHFHIFVLFDHLAVNKIVTLRKVA